MEILTETFTYILYCVFGFGLLAFFVRIFTSFFK